MEEDELKYRSKHVVGLHEIGLTPHSPEEPNKCHIWTGEVNTAGDLHLIILLRPTLGRSFNINFIMIFLELITGILQYFTARFFGLEIIVRSFVKINKLST